MIGGKTKSGFAFKVDERILQDWRFVQALALAQSDVDTAKLKGANDVVSLLLDKEADNLVKHLMELNDGFAPVDKLMSEVGEIMEKVKAKNSTSSRS